MYIEKEIRGEVAILAVSGRLMCRPDVAPFHDRIGELVADGIRQVVVDFSKVEWFGAAMLGVLVAGLGTLREAGGDMRLAGITEKVDRALRATHLSDVFRFQFAVPLRSSAVPLYSPHRDPMKAAVPALPSVGGRGRGAGCPAP